MSPDLVGAPRGLGPAGLPALLVVALSAFVVLALRDTQVSISESAAIVSGGAVNAVIVVVATLRQSRGQQQVPWPRLVRRLGTLVAIVLLLLIMPGGNGGEIPERLGGPDEPQQPSPGQPTPSPGESEFSSPERPSGGWPLEWIALGVLIAVLAGVGWSLARQYLRRWRARRVSRVTAVGPGGPVAEGDDPEELRRRRAVREGLTRGRAALAGADDPRHAVVLAYLAFERHVTERGLAREPAETQREYAARVLAAGGLDNPDRIGPLVELFNAARFSELPITDAEASAARDHIDAMVGD